MQQERPLQQCTRWFDTLAIHFGELSRAQLRSLALWSYAATMTQHIGSTTCAAFLAHLFGQRFDNLSQRLREFYRPAEGKRGEHRQALQADACFAPLLGWILTLYRAEELVLALDATLCRDRFAVLSVSVVFRGSALPVAWKVLPANQQGAWTEHCATLFNRLSKAVPRRGSSAMPVLVLCDRGLQSPALFKAICEQGWHPMMRLVRLAYWREEGHQTWHALKDLLPGPGCYYIGRGHLFKTDPLPCTLVALWEEGYEAPWLLMSDLPPERCSGAFYGLRSWIEQGFRCLKSGAYQCERLRVSEPERAERIWLVLAVSLVWTHALGAESQDEEAPRGLSALLAHGVRRVLGVHRTGWIVLLTAALRGEPLPLPGQLYAAPRPESPHGIAVSLRAPP